MTTTFRPPRQWVLTENETINSFANWQSNIKYYISLNNEFSPYLDSEWQKASVTTHGLANDPNTVDENVRKTAVQKCIVLDRMLGIIAQYSPSLLRNDIMKKSLSLSWIWTRIRKYYSFQKSEVNFLKLSTIKRQEGERYETLYQRIVAHIEDNLLTIESGLIHDGAAPAADEEMAPTTERLAVYIWLMLIDERLPSYISRVYAHDMQTKSLKDLQPQIVDNMDSLLQEINAQEDIQVHYSRTSIPRSRKFLPPTNRSGKQPTPQKQFKTCLLCKTAGRPHQGHDVSSCWYISKVDKLALVSALKVDVDDLVEDNLTEVEVVNQFEEMTIQQAASNLNDNTTFSYEVKRVQCSASPYFYAFYAHHPCKCIVDTGATSSLISSNFLQVTGIKVKPTRHAARQVDRSSIPIKGEIHIMLSYGNLRLPIDALVVDSLDSDILIGVPFCKENDVSVHLQQESIMIQGMHIPYGAKPHTVHDLKRAESHVLRNDSSKVLFPGEFLEIRCDTLQGYNGEVAIEPRSDSPLDGSWPNPTVSRVIQNTVRIPNTSNEPIKLSKFQHIAQIRSVITPTAPAMTSGPVNTTKAAQLTIPKADQLFSSLISVDPDNHLTVDEKGAFISLHKQYDSVFNPRYGVYNDYSGVVRAHVNFGPIKPPPRKSKLPFYNTPDLQLLQQKADELEELGVLARPEDLGIIVQHASPSFLVRRPSGGTRLVTAFNDLSPYVRIPPTASSDCNSVLRKLSRWKYIIKTDLTSAYFQIPLAKSSIPYLGTPTPFKGLRVYTRPGMGLPGAAEYLQELLSRVLGDELEAGFVLTNADDMYTGGATIKELLINWSAVLEKMYLNNLKLSATKTVVCPVKTVILGWIWQSGTLSISSHKLSPLILAEPPKTCSSMRSYIGAYKALSQCIPSYAKLLSPLEDSIKGLQGNGAINWSPELVAHFKKSQNALKSPHVITIPSPSDTLVITTDGSPLNNGLGATLFTVRKGKRLVSGFYSFKLKSHQQTWLPCEFEALAIAAAINHFGPYIRESKNKVQILTDSKPCVQAYHRLCRGEFSASARVSTFLTQLSSYNVVVNHLKGSLNTSSDYISRNPNECSDSSCQICKFVDETANSTVRSVTVDDILSGNARMPFTNNNAWHSAQHNCQDLRRTYAHLTQGTRPSRKTRNIKNVRRYLLKCTVTDKGLIVVRKPDPFQKQRELIVVPADIMHGLITALHLYFTHPTAHQLGKLFDRYFYGLGSNKIISEVTNKCVHCNSLKRVPNEIFEQTSSASPTIVGSQFAADVIQRSKQHILVVRDVLSSYTSSSILPNETGDSLRAALLINTAPLRMPICAVRVDNASGFLTLKDDHLLTANGITLTYGRVKNINKNPVAERSNQELELELLRIDASGSPVTPLALSTATNTLNSRIRFQGLSAKEMVFGRDQYSGNKLEIDGSQIAKQQEKVRASNHTASAFSKATVKRKASKACVKVGDLVFIKTEGSKNKARERYIVTQILDGNAVLQKMNSSKFMSRKYEVPLTNIFPAIDNKPSSRTLHDNRVVTSDDTSEEDEIADVPFNDNDAIDATESSNEEDEYNSSESDDGDNVNIDDPSQRPVRNAQRPAWLRGDEWVRLVSYEGEE